MTLWATKSISRSLDLLLLLLLWSSNASGEPPFMHPNINFWYPPIFIHRIINMFSLSFSKKGESTRNKFNTNYPKKKHLSLHPSLGESILPAAGGHHDFAPRSWSAFAHFPPSKPPKRPWKRQSVGWVFLHDDRKGLVGRNIHGPKNDMNSQDFTFGRFERNIQTYISCKNNEKYNLSVYQVSRYSKFIKYGYSIQSVPLPTH